MRSRCRGCRYSFIANVSEEGEMLVACQYYIKTGKRRPSPPEEECTVYKARKRKEGDTHGLA